MMHSGMQISENIKDLYKRLIAIQHVQDSPEVDADLIRVDDTVSKLSYFYEKLRNTMDYQEDHLLRRYAIERNLKRRIVLETLKPQIARTLIEELIRSGYIPNNVLPETVVAAVATVLNKYTYLIQLIHDTLPATGDRRKIIHWVTGVMACEIDLLLVTEDRADALIETLYSIVKNRIKYKGQQLPQREQNIQLYITLHKELVKSDNQIIAFHLLNLYFPDWRTADRELVEFLASKITSVYHGIETHLKNPIRLRIAKSLKKHIVVFKVLRELVSRHANDLVGLFSNPEYLESEARVVIDDANKTIKRKLRRSSLRAIAYIFITKIALAFALEYPYDVYIAKHVNYIALTTNIALPPLIMFLVTLSARLPGTANTKLILKELKTIIYGDQEETILCELTIRKQRGALYFFFENLFYALLYGFIFGIIFYVLARFRFNVLSGGIFLFFITAVSFFGTRIRQLAKEFNVEIKREGFRSILVIFFSLPIIRAGHWMSVNLRRINLFTFILDFIIEAPFKLLIQLIENWFIFLREKREDTFKNN